MAGDWERADQLRQSAAEAAGDGNWATAAAMCIEAAECFARAGDVFGQGAALAERGSYLFRGGEFEEALGAYREAAACATASDDMRLSARALWGGADCLAQLGRWQEVADEAGRAMAVMRTYEYTDLLGSTLLLTARARYWLDDQAGALQAAAEARDAFRAAGNARGVFDTDDLTVTALIFLQRADEALPVASRNVATARAREGTGLLAYAERRSGEALLAAGLESDALKTFERSRDLYRAQNRTGAVGVCDLWIGRAYRRMGRHQRAARRFADAVAALDAVGWDDGCEEARYELAQALYELDGAGEEAIARHRELLQPLLAGERDHITWRDVQVLLRFVAGKVRTLDAAGASQVLRAVEGLRPERASDREQAAFELLAARAWVDWHDGRQLEAVERALDLADRPDAVHVGLPQAWVLEVVGTAHQGQSEGVACLARATVIYQRTGEFDRAAALDQKIMAQTEEPRLRLPAQMWLPLTGTAADRGPSQPVGTAA